jgi:hypothetical protein
MRSSRANSPMVRTDINSVFSMRTLKRSSKKNTVSATASES